MEKRTVAEGQGDGIERCRRILQQGLALNPTDAKILQVSCISCHTSTPPPSPPSYDLCDRV